MEKEQEKIKTCERMNAIEFFSFIFGAIQLVSSFLILCVGVFTYLREGFCPFIVQIFILLILSNILGLILLIPFIRFELKKIETRRKKINQNEHSIK